jgi:hypothetical protein
VAGTNADAPASDTKVGADADVFAVELKRWRDVRGFSRAALAKQMG